MTIGRTVPAGLSERQAAEVRVRVGANVIPEPARPGVLARVLAQLRDLMIMLLLAAAVLAVVLGDVTDTTVIVAVIVLNTGVGLAQELRAERSLAALRRMSAPSARVMRDGRRVVVPVAEVVPGDVVLLDAGDIVPADATLLRSHGVQADEAALTGESVPVDKASEDEVHAGTVITRGRGTAVVSRTGPASSLGRIAALLSEQRPRPTPLQRRLGALGRTLALAALVLSAVVAVAGLLRGQPFAEMVLTGVSLAVAAVPESLPAVVTLALALGAHRMARRAAVVRALPAVETLGSVTVLATDKTGTLTEGRMLVERVWTPVTGDLAVTGSGYDPEGTIEPAQPGALDALLRDVVLCNDADLRPPDDERPRWQPMGDPTEAALLALAVKGGLGPDRLRSAFPRQAEVPFDSTTKLMITAHRGPDGWLVVAKGAPEVLLDRVQPGAEVDRAHAVAARLARAGHRVLAVADRELPAGPQPAIGGAEPMLRLAGLVAITDPPRPAARAVVETFQRAGVRLLLITGDHPHTARALAERVGIPGEVATGDGHRRDDVSVYARTRPEQKLEIVRNWQDRGHVVAMTGDGVNDAPALRRADIGVAMGGEGTEVAQQAADLILTDDNLGTVAAAIEEGRRIYANVRTFLRYALSGGVAEVLVMLFGPLLGMPLPLLPAQILWVNMLTHGLPGVALGAEPASRGIMRAAPRSPQEFVLGGGLWQRVAWTGALIGAITLGVGAWAQATGRPWQSLVFVCLGLAQLGIAMALRQPGSRRRLRFLDLAVAGSVLLQLAGIYLPPLRALLGTHPVTAADLALVAAVAAVPGLAVLVTQRRRRLADSE
jgi:P-type Ca2+ transporter type 2C